MSDGPTRGRFPALWPAEDVPDVAWTYWSLVDTMRSAPGMYGLDERRGKLHADLCRVYGLTREQTLSVTDNLDRYETAVDMDIALRKVKANAEAHGRAVADTLEDIVRCENCGGSGIVSYNPNLNPNSFAGTATAKCTRCGGTGIGDTAINQRDNLVENVAKILSAKPKKNISG